MLCMFRSSALLTGLYVMAGVLLLGANAYEEESGATPPAEKTPKPKAKKVYTNEDLKTLKETSRVNQAPGAVAPAGGSKKGGSIEAYRDAQGHDREYWQKRMRPLNNQLETLDSQIAVQQAKYDRLNAASGVKLSRSGKLRASSSDTRAQVAKRIDDLKQKRDEVLKSKQDLEEEARKAQALPEWLR
jgi:chromosome segregation ATPase